jgi:predicted phosphodiesterase
MRVALLSDIHGNDVALRATLADIKRRGVDEIVCLGDVATLGASPQRAVDLLAELNCPCIMGNHDVFLLEPTLVKAYTQAAPVIDAIDWCRAELSQESFDYLRTFKPIAELPLGSGSMLLYHGSPRSNVEDILATSPPELLDRLFEGQRANIMAGGHTHVQMLRQHRGRLVLNVGSVGMPFKEYVAGARPTILAHAEYAIVEEAQGVVGVTLHRVPLDKSAVRDSLAQSTNPLRDWLIEQYA